MRIKDDKVSAPGGSVGVSHTEQDERPVDAQPLLLDRVRQQRIDVMELFVSARSSVKHCGFFIQQSHKGQV